MDEQEARWRVLYAHAIEEATAAINAEQWVRAYHCTQGAHAILTKLMLLRSDNVVYTTSDRFLAYRLVGQLSRETGLAFDVQSRPSGRYLREGGYANGT